MADGVLLGDLIAGEGKGLRDEEEVVNVVACCRAELGEERTGDFEGVCVLLVCEAEPAKGMCEH